MSNPASRCCMLALLSLMVLALGGCDSVGTKIGKEACECMSKQQDKFMAIDTCQANITSKFGEYIDADTRNFKDPKILKDYFAVMQKCASDLSERAKSR